MADNVRDVLILVLVTVACLTAWWAHSRAEAARRAADRKVAELRRQAWMDGYGQALDSVADRLTLADAVITLAASPTNIGEQAARVVRYAEQQRPTVEAPR